MRCTVIDDEPFAMELIKGYVLKTPFLELADCFSNPFKALNYLTATSVDLIFLDINMPELSGIQLLKSLPNPPKVIFTTAYPEYGAESYEYNAVDYLLKPLKYERFLKAVNKAVELLNQKKQATVDPETMAKSRKDILIKSGNQLIKLNPDEILYVEGSGNYMTFHAAGKKIMSLLTMTEVMECLPADIFVRIHKSFVVSMKHIEMIEKHDVYVHGKALPIGNTYREQFFSKLGGGNNKENFSVI
ncbi:MAG: LytTR family DNA-binding domain-containing protein [Bacteroidota bacterium]